MLRPVAGLWRLRSLCLPLDQIDYHRNYDDSQLREQLDIVWDREFIGSAASVNGNRQKCEQNDAEYTESHPKLGEDESGQKHEEPDEDQHSDQTDGHFLTARM